MTSLHTKLKNVRLEDGERTTIALEPEFWDMLGKIGRKQGITLTVLIQEIEKVRGIVPRSGALRLFAADYFYNLAMGNDDDLFVTDWRLRKPSFSLANARDQARLE